VAEPGVTAQVTPGGSPPIRVRVNDETTITYDGAAYSDGDEVELPGPLAQSFAAQGHVTLLLEPEEGEAAE
jgi:hypothetical protein